MDPMSIVEDTERSVLPNHPSTRPRRVKSCFGRVKISAII